MRSRPPHGPPVPAPSPARGIRGVCEDYRAGATVDLEHDRADRAAGRRIAAPVLVLWQEPGGEPAPFDPLAIWRRWADDVTGHGLDAATSSPKSVPMRSRPQSASYSPLAELYLGG